MAMAMSSMVDAVSDGVCSPFSLHGDVEVSMEEQCWPGGAGERHIRPC